MAIPPSQSLLARLPGTAAFVATMVLLTSFVSPAPMGRSAPAPPPEPVPAPSRAHATGSPAALDRPPDAGLEARLDALLGARAGDVSAAGLDLRRGQLLTYGPTSGMATASVAKLDILVTFLLQAQAVGRMPSPAELASVRAMIQHSDNAAASRLWSQVGGGAGVAAVNRRLGLAATVPGPAGFWGSTTTSAADQVRLLTAVLSPTSVLAEPYRGYARGVLEGVTPEQRWGVGNVGTPGGREPVAVKNGWLPRPKDGGRWVVTSVGRVTAGGDPLVLAVLTRSSVSMDAGIALVERVASVLRDALVGSRADTPRAEASRES